MKSGVLLAAGVLVLIAGVARADIFEWRDGDGTRHFTNKKSEIPVADGIQVVVTDPEVSAEPATTAPVVSEPEGEALVVYDDSAERDAYVEGLQQGLALAAGAGNTLQINAPLAVVAASGGWMPAPPPIGYYPYDPYYYPPYDSYPLYHYPLLATTFRHGRSGHRLHRRRFGAKFQHHHQPGVFARDRFTAFGPSLSPLSSRGFHHGLRRGARSTF